MTRGWLGIVSVPARGLALLGLTKSPLSKNSSVTFQHETSIRGKTDDRRETYNPHSSIPIIGPLRLPTIVRPLAKFDLMNFHIRNRRIRRTQIRKLDSCSIQTALALYADDGSWNTRLQQCLRRRMVQGVGAHRRQKIGRQS